MNAYIYIVLEVVDLGDRIFGVFSDFDVAFEYAIKVIESHRKQARNDKYVPHFYIERRPIHESPPESTRTPEALCQWFYLNNVYCR